MCTEQPPSRLAIFGNENLCLQEAFNRYLVIQSLVLPVSCTNACGLMQGKKNRPAGYHRCMSTVCCARVTENGYIHTYRSI